MASLLVFFEVSGPESLYFDFQFLFLVATTTQDEIHPQKWFVRMDEATETVSSNFVPRKDCDR